jgi:hypothetical protein
LVFGATVLDVAPTVLTWFGLPIGEDMEGRVLLEGFGEAPEVTRVASWELNAARVSPPAAEACGSGPSSPASATLQRESDWNLAQSFMDAGRYEEALPVLEQLFRAFPERVELGQGLFQTGVRGSTVWGAELSLDRAPRRGRRVNGQITGNSEDPC